MIIVRAHHADSSFSNKKFKSHTEKYELFTPSPLFDYYLFSIMFPTLLSTASASRWYHNKPTQQEKLADIEYMEEKLAEQRMADREVGVRILIRGKPAINLKISQINEQEDEHEEMAEEEPMGDRFIEPEEPEEEEEEQDQRHFNTYNSNSDLYHAYEPDDEDDDNQGLPSSDNNHFDFSFSQPSP